jgi:hypothetical protein
LGIRAAQRRSANILGELIYPVLSGWFECSMTGKQETGPFKYQSETFVRLNQLEKLNAAWLAFDRLVSPFVARLRAHG